MGQGRTVTLQPFPNYFTFYLTEMCCDFSEVTLRTLMTFTPFYLTADPAVPIEIGSELLISGLCAVDYEPHFLSPLDNCIMVETVAQAPLHGIFSFSGFVAPNLLSFSFTLPATSL